VERWNPYAKIRQDLFGFADILYILGPDTVFLQVANGTDHQKRIRKILAEPRARTILEAGNLIEVWTYSKRSKIGKDGKKTKVKEWRARKQAVTLEDMDEEILRGNLGPGA
jgi:ketopantoate reductase